VIIELIESRVISLEDGLTFANNQNNMLLSLKGLTATQDFVRHDGKPVPVGALADPASMLGLIE
jgi:hypothetical protein